MQLIGKLSSNDSSKVGMLPSASKEYFINFQNIVYTFSLTTTNLTESKVAPTCKRESRYLNTSNIFITFKITTMLGTEVLSCNETFLNI